MGAPSGRGLILAIQRAHYGIKPEFCNYFMVRHRSYSHTNQLPRMSYSRSYFSVFSVTWVVSEALLRLSGSIRLARWWRRSPLIGWIGRGGERRSGTTGELRRQTESSLKESCGDKRSHR